jgi:hypothetical protein
MVSMPIAQSPRLLGERERGVFEDIEIRMAGWQHVSDNSPPEQLARVLIIGQVQKKDCLALTVMPMLSNAWQEGGLGKRPVRRYASLFARELVRTWKTTL